MKKYLIAGCCFLCLQIHAQTKTVRFVEHVDQKKIDVLIDGKSFTNFLFNDGSEKPILFPLKTADGQTLTRGFPIAEEADESTDHPHQVGLWFNYENVNGLDFWNNSYAIKEDQKAKYGWIRNVKITALENGKKNGTLNYSANWEQQDGKVLLKELTTYVFKGTDDTRTIDRITTLVAEKDTVYFKDIKDGLLGIRVTKALELPSTGNYLTSMGKKGNDAWGSRAAWCMLYGAKNKVPVSITIIDHPKNPGYPTYWHARDYGLFAANPLGQEIFSRGKEQMNLTLKPGQSVTFRYRVLITSGRIQNTDALNKEAKEFSK